MKIDEKTIKLLSGVKASKQLLVIRQLHSLYAQIQGLRCELEDYLTLAEYHELIKHTVLSKTEETRTPPKIQAPVENITPVRKLNISDTYPVDFRLALFDKQKDTYRQFLQSLKELDWKSFVENYPNEKAITQEQAKQAWNQVFESLVAVNAERQSVFEFLMSQRELMKKCLMSGVKLDYLLRETPLGLHKAKVHPLMPYITILKEEFETSKDALLNQLQHVLNDLFDNTEQLVASPTRKAIKQSHLTRYKKAIKCKLYEGSHARSEVEIIKRLLAHKDFFEDHVRVNGKAFEFCKHLNISYTPTLKVLKTIGYSRTTKALFKI